MNNITQKQNEPISIERLKAQRKLYSVAKKISFASFMLFVIPVVIGHVLKIWFGGYELFMNIFVIYAAVASILKIVISMCAKKTKKRAAAIQQLFDAHIYSMAWKKVWGAEPTQEFVCQHARKEPDTKLKDWYEPLIEKANHNVGVLLCQMENVRYDERLKVRFYMWTHIVFWVYVAVSVLFGMYYFQENTSDFLLKTMVPLAPIVVLYLTLVYNRYGEVEQRGKLDAAISDAWRIAKAHHTVSIQKLEEIQTILYAYRCEVNAVPDWFYNRHRNLLEGLAYQSTKVRLVELNLIKSEEI